MDLRRPSSRRVYPRRPVRTPRLPHGKEAVAVDRGDGDDLHLLVALDGELDKVAGPPRPQLLVELLLRGDGYAVDPEDAIALPEPGPRRRPRRGRLADQKARGRGDGVEPEPRPRRTTCDAAGRDQLVLHRHELLDGHGQVDVRRVAEPERGDADDLAALVHDGAAAPLRAGRRHDDRPVEHVLPVRREAPNRVDRARDLDEIVVLVDADRAGPGAGGDRVRVTEGRGRPRTGALELHDAEAGVEVEAHYARGHGAPVTPLRLDRDRVQQQVAHRDHVAALIEDHAAAETAAAEPGGRVGLLIVAHVQRDDRGLDAPDEGR